jgi:hypothetical protein
MNESIIWLYDRREALIELLETARHALIHELSQEPRARDKRIYTRVRQKVSAAYLELNTNGLFPYETIDVAAGPNSLTGMVKTAQSSMFALIASNHARRSNEVIGHNKPYGLSINSLSSIGDGYHEWSIEFYVEKTIQDYDVFLCNELVADAFSFLVDIYNELRELEEPNVVVPFNREDGRPQKLFTSRDLTIPGMRGNRISLRLRRGMSEYFRLANVDQSKFRNQQLPYRRMYSCLFMHRYDCPEVLALSRHLRHWSPEQTIPYYTDPADGKATPRMRVLLARRRTEATAIKRAIVQGRSDYLVEKVREIFEGSTAGGFFPRLVLRLAKRLSASTTFRLEPLQQKAHTVSTILEKRGYLPDVYEHGACLAENPRHTIKASNCYHDGELHKEEASPKKCHRCIHNLNNDNYLSHLQCDADKSLKSSTDFSLTPLLREGHAAHAKTLIDLIAAERSLADETRQLFEALESTWVQVFCGE